MSTVKSQFKKDLNLQIHLRKKFFSDDRFSDLVSTQIFLKSNNFQFKKEKMGFLNRNLPVLFKSREAITRGIFF